MNTTTELAISAEVDKIKARVESAFAAAANGEATKSELIRLIKNLEETFHDLAEALERHEDVASLALVVEAPGDFLHLELADRVAAGESAVKILRIHRAKTQADVAGAAGISQNYLSEIEGGQKSGSVEVLKAIAQVLDVDLDDLT